MIWKITLKNFNTGFAPLAFIDPLTEGGGAGHSSKMKNVDLLDGKLTQGSALTDLTNGNQTGVVDELINFIMDKAVASNESYAIGTSKLFKITPTAVISDATFPQVITNCVDGQSIQVLKGNLYYLYNTASAGAIGKYDFTTFTHNWNTTGMLKAPHPSDKKEDILLFGNGRYVGTYIDTGAVFNAQKLDFGQDALVEDVLYHSGQWYIVVNSGFDGGRTKGQIYLYDGSAIPTTLNDETGVGMQKIGFLYRLNGIIYVAYQDLSSEGFIIGWISGSQIKPLGRFIGTLPNFQQKTLFKNTILFLSSGMVYSAGALVDELPFQLSQIFDGGHATVGAVACPFGTPLISSTDGSTDFRLAKTSGYDTDCSWESIIMPLVSGLNLGYIDNITVLTNSLGAGARCDLTIKADQESITSKVHQITGTGKTRHHFRNIGLKAMQDFKVALSFANGSATNNVVVRQIIITGHQVEQ